MKALYGCQALMRSHVECREQTYVRLSGIRVCKRHYNAIKHSFEKAVLPDGAYVPARDRSLQRMGQEG